MKNIFEKDLSGEMVSPNEQGYEALINDIFATIKTATEMNTGYRTPEEVHEYMGRILDKPLEESTTVLPPLYIDYGKPITIGKGCFIQQCCTFFGRGGITIGNDVFIGPKVNLITINHDPNPENRSPPMVVRLSSRTKHGLVSIRLYYRECVSVTVQLSEPAAW